MKRTSKFASLISACAALAQMAGCGPSPLLRVTNQVVNMGQGLPDDMLNRHIAGVVAFDEVWADEYNRVARNQLYTQGVERGKSEYNYRVVRMNLHQTSSGLWIGKGELLFPTGAYVPDHLPRLHAGDVVEIRQTGTWMTMENFAATGEGNVVVRLLCAKAERTYDTCLEQGPKVGKIAGVGETNTAYPASAKDYGFSFTPMFDVKGNALRQYPQSSASPAH